MYYSPYSHTAYCTHTAEMFASMSSRRMFLGARRRGGGGGAGSLSCSSNFGLAYYCACLQILLLSSRPWAYVNVNVQMPSRSSFFSSSSSRGSSFPSSSPVPPSRRLGISSSSCAPLVRRHLLYVNDESSLLPNFEESSSFSKVNECYICRYK